LRHSSVTESCCFRPFIAAGKNNVRQQMPPNYSFLALPRILEHLEISAPELDEASGKVAFIMKIAFYLLLASMASVQLTGQALPAIN
jgi:hypothetical protein